MALQFLIYFDILRIYGQDFFENKIKCADMEYDNDRFDLGIPCNQVLMVCQMGSNEDTTYVNVTLTNNATYRAKGETES